MKVSIFDAHRFERESLQCSADGRHELLFLDMRLNKQTATLALDSDAVCLFVNDEATAAVLELLAAQGVRYIALRSAGYNHVDLEAARALSLSVANVPEYSPYAVAEHTVAMILALNRKLVQANRRIMELNFSLDGLVGFDMHGKTIGVVGLGKIGRIVAKILSGFGCRILGVDRVRDQDLIDRYDVSYVDVDTMCKEADIITLHAPLLPETKHLIDERRLGLMKQGAMLINTSRGGLVDTKAAVRALKQKHLGYFGIDVYEEEAGLFFEDHSDDDLLQDDVISRLMTFKNVLITSHQAFLTKTALQNIADTTMENLDCWSRGENAPHELT